jgi:hypothetical protein
MLIPPVATEAEDAVVPLEIPLSGYALSADEVAAEAGDSF